MGVHIFFTHCVLADQTPQRRKTPNQTPNREIRVFQAILTRDGLWHLEKSWARTENRKTQFPGARGPEIEEKKVTTLSGVVVPKNFTVSVLPDRTPTGGKSQNMGVLAILA